MARIVNCDHQHIHDANDADRFHREATAIVFQVTEPYATSFHYENNIDHVIGAFSAGMEVRHATNINVAVMECARAAHDGRAASNSVNSIVVEVRVRRHDHVRLDHGKRAQESGAIHPVLKRVYERTNTL